MASNYTHTFATTDEQYEAFMLQAIKESLQSAEEEALIQKLDDESLHFAIQSSLKVSVIKGDKKPLPLLARRGMPPLIFTPKAPQTSVKPYVDIIIPSSEEKESRKTTRC